MMRQDHRNTMRVFGLSLIGFVLFQIGFAALLGAIDKRAGWPEAEMAHWT